MAKKKANSDLIIKKKLIETKEDFYYLDPLKNIPEEFWGREVWIQSPDKRNPIQLDCKMRLRDYLNERFILYQFGLDGISFELYDILPEMSLREVWYYIEILAERDKKPMDSGYSGFYSGISDYLKAIYEKIELPYWAYAYDNLKIKAKAKAMIYTYDKKELQWLSIGLDKNTLKTYTNAYFFLILCEKEDTIEPFLKELIKRGYNKEYFYCINLGGESPSNAIRLIREYLPIRHFHCFVLHDMDMKGLEIFFDMKRHFHCKSIGVNPEFLKYCGYDFEKLCEKYKTKTGKSRETVSSQLEDGTRTVFNELDISVKEREKYNDWINMCIRRRIELNSITAHRIENTPLESKVKDFVDYFVYIMEKSKWDLTRARDLRKEGYSQITIEEKISKYKILRRTGQKNWTIKPRLNILQVKEPKFIGDVREKGENIFIEESKSFLDKTKELKDLFDDFYDQMINIFDNMNEKEESIRDQKIDDFIEENEQLFDLSWDDVIEDKKNKMRYGVKMLEKYLRLKCIKEYVITKRGLVNYIGSIKYPIPIIEEREIRMGNTVFNYKFTENKKVEKSNKILERCVKRTEEYKRAKEETIRLTEELDKLEVKEDKRLKFLGNFKEKMEKAFKELIGDLNDFNNKTND